MNATSSPAGRPLPSSTVVLLRENANGPEVLLVLRHARTSFGSTYVFPGGLLERDDSAVQDRCDGVDRQDADATLGTRSDGIAYFSAAIRELFEEAGVLLARDGAGDWANAARLCAERDALNAGKLQWADFLSRHDLRLACDALHYFSFWITPREIPRRFTTRFFAAALPAGQVATHCGSELTDSRWLSPAAALEENRREGFDLPHPTRLTLESLQNFSDTASILSWAGAAGRAGVTPVLPVLLEKGGQTSVLMPGDANYPAIAPGADEQ